MATYNYLEWVRNKARKSGDHEAKRNEKERAEQISKKYAQKKRSQEKEGREHG